MLAKELEDTKLKLQQLQSNLASSATPLPVNPPQVAAVTPGHPKKPSKSEVANGNGLGGLSSSPIFMSKISTFLIIHQSWLSVRCFHIIPPSILMAFKFPMQEPLSEAAQQARLRRVCEYKPSQKLNCPDWLHEQWKIPSNRPAMIKKFAEVGWDKDHFFLIDFFQYKECRTSLWVFIYISQNHFLPFFLLHPFHLWSLLSVANASCRKLLSTSSQSSERRPWRRSWMCRVGFTPRPRWLNNWDGMSHALKTLPHHWLPLHFPISNSHSHRNHAILFCIQWRLCKHECYIIHGIEKHQLPRKAERTCLGNVSMGRWRNAAGRMDWYGLGLEQSP